MPLPNRAYAVSPLRKEVINRTRSEQTNALRQEELRVKDKIDQTNRVLDALDARTASLARQIAALQKRKKIACDRVERIEAQALRELERIGRKRVDGFKSSLEMRPCPTSVNIVDASLIPEEYLKIEEIRTPIKALIKAALERKLPVLGARLAQNTSLIRKL